MTVISGGGRLARALLNVRHISLPYFKKRFLPYLFLRLFFIVRREKFDVIHAHTRLSAFVLRPLARRRLAVTAHWVFDARFPKRELTAWGEETLAVSTDIAEYLQSVYGCKKQRITLTCNGIDTVRFFPEKSTAKKRRIVCCTRMDHDRADAAFALLKAAEELPPDAFSVKIIGDGDRFTALKQRYEEIKAKNPALDICLLGGVSDVAPHLRDADIFVGVSRAALEGMASGCATVLAGNEGYLSVFDPQNALLAERSNFCCRGAEKTEAELLTRDLLYLLSLSREELSRMGNENRRYVLARYTVARMADDALSVYEKICKRRCVLCGYYGFHNVGDTLLARALKEHLKKQGYARILVLSSRHLSIPAVRALKGGYDLILGGGNLLQDATSRRSLSFYLFCAKHARRTEIYGGIGPLSFSGEERTKLLLKKARFYARTKGDLAYAKTLGAQNASLSADTALTLPFPQKAGGDRILLAFRAPKPDAAPAFLAFASSLCRRFDKERCFLFVMHPADRAFSRRVAQLCNISLFEGDADDFLTALKGCRAVFSSRLHAGIAALGMGIPFFLWRGEKKCRFFVEDLKSTAESSDFCGLFSLNDRIKALPAAKGMEQAKRLMQERI